MSADLASSRHRALGRAGWLAAGLLAPWLLSACVTTGQGGAPPPATPSLGALPVVDVPDLKEQALLVMLSDRHLYEPYSVQMTFDGPAPVREALAVALGRIADPRGETVLETLLRDESLAVRRAAAFALGEGGFEGSKEDLLRAAAMPDRELGSLAVEALGKLGASLAEVRESLAPVGLEEGRARLLPHLFRFDEEHTVPLAEEVLESSEVALRQGAAHALGRQARPEAAPALRRLLTDSDPWVRGWAARGLGTVGDASDLARILPLAEGAEAGPAVQALRAARRLVDEGKAAAPRSWVPRLLDLLDDPRPQMRLAVLEVAGAWLLEEELGAALAEKAAASDAEARLALLALAQGEDPRARDLALRASRSPEPRPRVAAAQAAGILEDRGLLEELANDPNGGVRATVLEERLGLVGAPEAVAAEGLQDPDPAVKATAFSWLTEHPVLPMQELGTALVAALKDRSSESSLEGVRAVAARAEAEPLERGSLVELLENLSGYTDALVRREAAERLEALGRPRPAVGPYETGRDLGVYESVVQRTRKPRTVEVRTDQGSFRIRLACPRAPLTCLSFLSLARQGYYDGVTFHRVVPDFVVQGGDPRGDGYGGPGFTLRDEIHPLRYRRGTVGMALAGADTGGSQFFITLSAQPHLDGGYTAFGEVVDGLEVVERLVPDSRILGIVEIP